MSTQLIEQMLHILSNPHPYESKAKDYYNKSIHYRNFNGDLDAAEMFMRQAILYAPYNIDYSRELGLILIDRKQYEKAFVVFAEATKLIPASEHADFFHTVAEQLYENEEYNTAKICCDLAIHINSKQLNYHKTLSNIYVELAEDAKTTGNEKQVQQYSLQANKAAKKYEDLQQALAEDYYVQGEQAMQESKPDKALSRFAEAEILSRQLKEYYVAYGDRYRAKFGEALHAQTASEIEELLGVIKKEEGEQAAKEQAVSVELKKSPVKSETTIPAPIPEVKAKSPFWNPTAKNKKPGGNQVTQEAGKHITKKPKQDASPTHSKRP